MISLPIMALLVSLAHFQETVEPLATATRGITGTVTVQSPHGSIRGRADLDLDSPLLVRIAAIGQNASGVRTYDLEFIGTVPGHFDLRDVLVFTDGSSLDQLAAIPIQIVSNLEDNAPSDLAMTVPPVTRFTGGYLTWLIIIAATWIGIPLLVLLRRLTRPRPVVTPPELPPSLADQLEPLVEAAANRTLSIAEQGRLELLLYWHWQEQLGLDETRSTAVAHLRRHDTAGQLLRSIESWLHDPTATPPSRNEITTLLQPYRRVPGQVMT